MITPTIQLTSVSISLSKGENRSVGVLFLHDKDEVHSFIYKPERKHFMMKQYDRAVVAMLDGEDFIIEPELMEML